MFTKKITESPADLRNNLYGVGPTKPMGYLPLKTVTLVLNDEPSKVSSDLIARGLTVFTVSEEASGVIGGALCAFDEAALTDLISTKPDLTRTQTGGTLRASTFAEWLMCNQADPRTPFYDLCADAFGDKSDPNRTDYVALAQESASWTSRFSKLLRRGDKSHTTTIGANPSGMSISGSEEI